MQLFKKDLWKNRNLFEIVSPIRILMNSSSGMNSLKKLYLEFFKWIISASQILIIYYQIIKREEKSKFQVLSH